MPKTYDVGGVKLERPFKVRRLNHLVLYYNSPFKEIVRFYIGLLGLRLADCNDDRAAIPGIREFVNSTNPFAFMTIGTDHHNFAFAPESMKVMFKGRQNDTMIHHYAWDLGSYDELKGFLSHCRNSGVEVNEVAMRMPGSNYTIYYFDPEMNRQHTQWNMEVIGWNGSTKPSSIWPKLGFMRGPQGQLDDTVPSDEVLTAQTLAAFEGSGMPLVHSTAPYQGLVSEVKRELGGRSYNVHGTVLSRPFALAKLSYLEIAVNDMKKMLDFYTKFMGFKVSDRTRDSAYLRHGVDHHGLVLRSRDPEGVLSKASAKRSRPAIEVRTYTELKAALDYLKDMGLEITSKGRLFPGGEYYFDTLGPERQPVRIFFYLEKVGWDARSRPRKLWKPLRNLPQAAEVTSDVYDEELPETYNVYTS